MTIGVLMLHGFSGGPYEVEPFARYIRERTDWIIEVPTLTGHGFPEQLSMAGVKAREWLEDAEKGYLQLASRVDEIIVVGFSMGGLLAMYLASRFCVKKLVLLSAALKYMNIGQLVQDVFSMVEDFRQKKLKENELFLRYEQKLKQVPYTATLQFMKVVRMARPHIMHISCPVYMVQGAKDGIVPVTTAYALSKLIQVEDKALYISERGKHHICYSVDREMWFYQVFRFLMQP